MEWDSNTHQLITCARLAILPADAVYEELKAYAEYHLNNHGYGDKTFEKVLLA